MCVYVCHRLGVGGIIMGSGIMSPTLQLLSIEMFVARPSIGMFFSTVGSADRVFLSSDPKVKKHANTSGCADRKYWINCPPGAAARQTLLLDVIYYSVPAPPATSEANLPIPPAVSEAAWPTPSAAPPTPSPTCSG